MQHKRDACMPIRTRPVHIRFVLRTTHSISLYCFLLHRIELVADPSHNTFWISLFFITSKRTCRSVHASNQILLPASKREQEKLDDDQSAAKMGGESGPTGRAILFRKQKYRTNAEINYGNLYFIHHRTITNTWMLHAPIGVCLFCLLRLCLRSIWLGRLRVVRWFPVLLQSVRLITSAGQAYRKPPIKLHAVVVVKFAHP